MSIFAIIRANKNSFLFILILFLLPFLASSLVVVGTIKYEQQIFNLTYFQWALLYAAAAVTMGLSLTHTTFIALLGGFFLGWLSLLYMMPAYCLASSIGYGLAKLIDKGIFLDSIKMIPGVPVIMENVRRKETFIIFFSRISPILPSGMMNALLSILRVNFTKFIFVGLMGMLPRTLLFIWLGIQGRNIKDILENPSDNLASKISFIVLMVISVLGLFYAFRNVTKKLEEKELPLH